MAQLFASLFPISFNTILIIFALCTLGSLVLRTQLEDPFISFAFQPILALLSVLIFVGLEAVGMIEPIITAEWIKGILVSSTMGIGIGIGLILLCVSKFEARSENVETALMRRQIEAAPKLKSRSNRVAAATRR